MILRTAEVHDFKSITDSGVVRLENAVTCLVGKNESGKTAFLEALYRLNPVPTGHPDRFSPLRDFPRSRYSAERDTVEAVHPITAVFELQPDDVEAVCDAVGPKVLTSSEVTVARTYGNRRLWTFDTDEQAAVLNLVSNYGASEALADECATVAALVEALEDQAAEGGGHAELLAAATALDVDRVIIDTLDPRLPKFFYFDEYSELPGRISIAHLQNTAEDQLTAGQRTALALLRLAGVESAEFTEDSYEPRRAALEAASSAISREVFEYWSQNKNLRVYFDVDFKSPGTDETDQPPVLEVRIENLRHFITLNFAERSAGFQWFFSFLAAFSEFRNTSDAIVLLLDEPALGLHATAQGDLLRYIDERLAEKRQVIYTTHSPFMVDPTRIERARTVEDREELGTTISEEVLGTSRETLFPLQAALGYELAQTLFVAPDNLVVEGPSDLLYIQILSEHLRSLGRVGLHARWVIVPVGGIDKVPTFIALLGAHLNVAVVLDGAAGGSQKVNAMIEKGIITADAVIPLATITATREADIEDMFETSFYLELVRDSGVASMTEEELPNGSRVVKRIEDAIGPFDHYRPSVQLLKNQEALLPKVDSATLDRFEALCSRANALLS